MKPRLFFNVDDFEGCVELRIFYPDFYVCLLEDGTTEVEPYLLTRDGFEVTVANHAAPGSGWEEVLWDVP